MWNIGFWIALLPCFVCICRGRVVPCSDLNCSVYFLNENVIEVDVTNLWPNRMIGDEQLPDDMEWSEPLNYEYAPGNPVVGRYLTSIPDWLRDGTPRPSGRKTVGCFKFFTKDSPLLPSGLVGNPRLLICKD